MSFSYILKLWVGALVGAALAWAVRPLVAGWHPIPLAIVVLGLYGSCYFLVGYLLGLPPARAILGRFLRFFPGRR